MKHKSGDLLGEQHFSFVGVHAPARKNDGILQLKQFSINQSAIIFESKIIYFYFVVLFYLKSCLCKKLFRVVQGKE
jgi:hypothetical protein